MVAEPHKSLLSRTGRKSGPVIATDPLFRETELKLLPMLFQVLFYGRYLAGVRRTKSPVFVDIDNPGVLKADNHIWSMIAIDIGEAKRDWNQVVAVTVELWTYIHARFRGVATRKLTS